jgi:CD2 antigen cytoplasmic tail-binding protein 2
MMKNKSSDDMIVEPTEKDTANTELLTKFSSFVDVAMSSGVLDIYDMTYEQIVRRLRLEEVLDDTWMPGDPVPQVADDLPDEKLWEYKWTTNDKEVHGPYTTAQLKEWKTAGYFPNPVLVREVTSSTPLDATSGFQSSIIDYLQ